MNNASYPSAAAAESSRYIRLPEVKSLTGFKSTGHLYTLMARGDFPRPIKIGKRAVAWKLSDISNYLSTRPHVELSGPSYERGYASLAVQSRAGE